MTRRNVRESPQSLVTNLLMKVHEQSRQSPERAPFWRDGQWRCEFHTNDGTPRLKVFSGATCVHEELIPSKSTAEQRSAELKREFVASRRRADD